jgi:hypothetical protein
VLHYLLAALLLTTPAAGQSYAPTFLSTWGDVMQDLEAMQRELYAGPRRVKTDRIQPTQAKAVAPEDVKPKPKPRTKDACARVGKRKVVTGKSWRCR